MYYIRFIMIAVILAIATFSPLWAIPDVPILEVDTLVDLGKITQGEASGAFFLPNGNIIAVIRDTPLIVDSKSGAVLRRLDSLIGQDIQCPKVSPDGRYLIAFSYKGTAVWDIVSGKILKMIGNATDYCFSPDGLKLYVIGGNPNHFGAVRIYDANTLEEIERFASFTGGTFLDLSPDGKILAASFGKAVNEQSFNQFVLINLNDKNNYTVVETFLSGVKSMEFSPDGKQIAFLHDGSTLNDMYLYIYNLENKEKKIITRQELSALFGFDIATIGNPFFVAQNIILFSVKGTSTNNYYFLDWDVNFNKIKYYIKYRTNRSIDVNDNTILLCNQFGVIGYLNKSRVPVKDETIQIERYLTYKNNHLEFTSNRAFVGESNIYDITGKLILNLGSQQFAIGKNIIKLNSALPFGIYILTINDKTNQSSYKFIVE